MVRRSGLMFRPAAQTGRASAAKWAAYQRRMHSTNSPADGPTLFDAEFNAAYDARQAELKKAADDVSATAEKRRLLPPFEGGRVRACYYCGRNSLILSEYTEPYCCWLYMLTCEPRVVLNSSRKRS